MRTLRAFGSALLTANFLTSTALGAQCVSTGDLSVLRIAALQQELMVAALTCHDVRRYNHFVLARRAELIDSDARLKTFFVQREARGGEASYHAYKTELANAASLRSIRQADTFCSHAEAAFDLASRPMSLSAFVAAQPLALGATYPLCRNRDRAMPLRAEAGSDNRDYDDER